MLILLIAALLLAWPTFGLSLVLCLGIYVVRRARFGRVLGGTPSIGKELNSAFDEKYREFFLSLDVPLLGGISGTALLDEESYECGRHMVNYISRNTSENRSFLDGLHRWRTKGSTELCDPVTAAQNESRYKAWHEIHLVSWRAIEAIMKNNRRLKCFRKIDLNALTSRIDAALSSPSKNETLLRKEAEINSFVKLAGRGDPEAQYRLGELLFNRNIDVRKQDLSPCLSTLKKSAEQGHDEAQYLLGEINALLYKKSEAKSWYLKSSSAGNFKASYGLGRLFFGEKNIENALHFYELSADQGSLDACVSIANIYDLGQLVPADKAKAAAWFETAAERGDLYSQSRVSKLYRTGVGVPQDISKADFWLNREETWYRLLAERGDAAGEYGLGSILTDSDNPYCDPAQGVFWLRKAEAQGHDGAADLIAMMGYDEEYPVS